MRTFIGEQPRTIGQAVPRLFPPGLVEQHEFKVAAHDDRYARRVHHDVAVLDLDRRLGGGLDRGLLCTALRRAADVEGAHRQLRTGFADRLGSDDPDRFADIDDRPAREIAPIAFAADAHPRLAGQHRADHHCVDAGALDPVDGVLVDQLTRR